MPAPLVVDSLTEFSLSTLKRKSAMHTTTLYFNEEKKHSVRYDADKKDDSACMSSVYISKAALSKPYPKVITVTIDAKEV